MKKFTSLFALLSCLGVVSALADNANITSLGLSTNLNGWDGIYDSFEPQGNNTWTLILDLSEVSTESEVLFKLRPNNNPWVGYTNDNTAIGGWITSKYDNEGGYNFQLMHSSYAYPKYLLTATWNPNWQADHGWYITVNGLDPIYTVVGDEALVGSNWNTYDSNNEMVFINNSRYELHKTVSLTQGSYGFKVVTNHRYTESYPHNPNVDNDNWIVNINQNGVYELTFVFDSNTHEIQCNGRDNPAQNVVLELTDETPFTATTGYSVSSASYSRTCTNQWGTLCLPFKFSAAQSGVTFYEMTDVTTGENGAITFTPIVGTNIEAGQPVAFKLNEGVTVLNVENSDENGVAVVTEAGTSEAVQGWSMLGTFKNTTLDNVYVIQDNEIHPTGTGLSIKPYRAWFSGSVSGGAPLRIEVADTEGLQFIEQEDGTVKAYYDLQGRKLDGARKGLVIENGKIIMVK